MGGNSWVLSSALSSHTDYEHNMLFLIERALKMSQLRQVDGKGIAQSKTIERFVAKKYGMMGGTPWRLFSHSK